MRGRDALAQARIEEHHCHPLTPDLIAAQGHQVLGIDGHGRPTRYARRIDRPAKALRLWLAAGWINHDHERAADLWGRYGAQAGLHSVKTSSWYGGSGAGPESLSAAKLDAIRWRAARGLPSDVVSRLDAVWVRREAPWITGRNGRERAAVYERCCDDLRMLLARL